jgi:hypothetical protein
MFVNTYQKSFLMALDKWNEMPTIEGINKPLGFGLALTFAIRERQGFY